MSGTGASGKRSREDYYEQVDNDVRLLAEERERQNAVYRQGVQSCYRFVDRICSRRLGTHDRIELVTRQQASFADMGNEDQIPTYLYEAAKEWDDAHRLWVVKTILRSIAFDVEHKFPTLEGQLHWVTFAEKVLIMVATKADWTAWRLVDGQPSAEHITTWLMSTPDPASAQASTPGDPA